MTKDEALKMAILQFERINKEYDCTEIIDICKEALEQLKEPQYLYVSKGVNGKPELSFIDHQDVINKIKLEIDDAMQ